MSELKLTQRHLYCLYFLVFLKSPVYRVDNPCQVTQVERN